MKMRRSRASRASGMSDSLQGVERVGEQMARPNREQAEHDGSDDIAARLEPLVVLSEGQSLQAEGGERGEATQQAKHHELTRCGAGEDASVRPGQGGEE